MPMLPAQAYRTPTQAEYATVKKVYEETGILTLKDRVTTEWVKPQKRCGDVPWESPHKYVPEYGARYNPKELDSARVREAKGFGGQHGAVGGTGAGAFGLDTFHIRGFEIELVGSLRLPQGVAIGGNEVWRRDVPLEIGGDDDGRTVKWYADISFEELNRLRAWANDVKWVTDADIKEADRVALHRREHKLETQEDPVGVIAKALAKATRGAPPAEVLEKAGIYQDEQGVWRVRQPAGAAK